MKKKINIVINQYLIIAIICLAGCLKYSSMFTNKLLPMVGAIICVLIIAKELLWSFRIISGQFQ